MVKFGRAVLELCERIRHIDRQTNKQTDNTHHNTSHPSREVGENEVTNCTVCQNTQFFTLQSFRLMAPFSKSGMFFR